MATKQRFPWVAVSAVVAFVMVVAVAWLQLPSDYPSAPTMGARLPVMVLTQLKPELSAELLAERLAAYDPTPLFIPTSMNSNEPPIPNDVRPGARGPFTEFAPELTKKGPLAFPSPVVVPAGPVEGLRLTERADAPLAMARADRAGGALPGRLGQVEAALADSGRVVLTLNLPMADGLPVVDWQPLELMGAVTRAGLLGELVITASSGSDEIDDYFRSQLRRNVRIGARLSAGFYVFRVGP
ncbi:MAG: hypothetical protein WC205_19350 [Opitutaceae bacterium]|jgi:hypothetical protein